MNFHISSNEGSIKHLHRAAEESARKMLEIRSRTETPTIKNVQENIFTKYDIQVKGIKLTKKKE